MKIFIITMDDPVQTYSFIKKIIDNRLNDIVGIAVPKGNRLTIGKKKSKFVYLLSLLLIMGLPAFIKNSFITLCFKFRSVFYKIGLSKNPSILNYAKSKGINTYNIKTPNSRKFQYILKKMDIDVIINQSQNIIKKNLLDIPKIGVINRHNALLPKNRGRLTPFWVLYKNEKKTGVSIHFVNEGIDAGDIIVQKEYFVTKKDTFNSLVKKNYKIAPNSMLEALNILEKDNYKLLPNKDKFATYNTTPSFKEAFKFRINLIKRKFVK